MGLHDCITRQILPEFTLNSNISLSPWNLLMRHLLGYSGRKNMETIRLFIHIGKVTHDKNRD
jgi:hypothetical protein